MGFLELAGAVLSIVAALLPTLITAWVDKRTAKKKVAHDLAKLELKDTQDTMARVDAQLDGVQPDQRQPILLSPDDHL